MSEPALEGEHLVVVPPDLKWLDEPTPFAPELKSMVGALRDKKTTINFAKAQCVARAKELRTQLEAEEFKILQYDEQLNGIENTIVSLAMVAEQSADLDMTKHTETTKHRSKPAGEFITKRWSRGPEVCRKEDVMEVFKKNPNTNFTAAELTELIPAVKRAHAKASIAQTINHLFNEHEIQRVSRGIYRYTAN